MGRRSVRTHDEILEWSDGPILSHFLVRSGESAEAAELRRNNVIHLSPSRSDEMPMPIARFVVRGLMVAATVALSLPGSTVDRVWAAGPIPAVRHPTRRPRRTTRTTPSHPRTCSGWPARPTGQGRTTRRPGTPAPPRAGPASVPRCSARHG